MAHLFRYMYLSKGRFSLLEGKCLVNCVHIYTMEMWGSGGMSPEEFSKLLQTKFLESLKFLVNMIEEVEMGMDLKMLFLKLR